VSLLRKAIDGIREEFGEPVSTIRTLAQHPGLNVGIKPDEKSIALASVTKWDELGGQPGLSWPRRVQGDLQGWRVSGGRYLSFRLQRAEYALLGRHEVTTRWACDLSQLHGFSSSKSRLKEFVSTDELVERNSPEMVTEVSREMLAKNLAHHEIRILHEPSCSDHFVRHAWDGRIFLANDGGSHHLAAAKYIACRLGQQVPLRAALHTYWLERHAVESLRREFDMFVMSDEPWGWNAFCDAMQAFRATWLWHYLPRPRAEGGRVVLLPQSEGKSRRVAAALRGAGFSDLGEHLAKLADRTALL
jgi:hypothetical protein